MCNEIENPLMMLINEIKEKFRILDEKEKEILDGINVESNIEESYEIMEEINRKLDELINV